MQSKSPIVVIAEAAALWVAADLGYYILFNRAEYNSHPVQIAIYYLCWLGITIFTFWDTLKSWRPLENRWWTYTILCLGGVAMVSYLIYILPNFQPINWSHSWKPPSELLYAQPGYFLPKSIDILLQQVLIVVILLTFVYEKFSFRETLTWCALLFGSAHLLLVLGGKDAIYVTGFTLAAVLASFWFTYLILKVKNGFIYSYFLHWLFYAVIIILTR